MGTRHLTMVVLNKKIKVAQYGQWDGYLSGQGENIFKFIYKNLSAPNSVKLITGGKNPNLEKFKKIISKCTWATKEELENAWNKHSKNKDGMGMEEYTSYSKEFPQFSRDTGSTILQLLLKAGPLPLNDETAFAADSLFCEWAYLLDLDKQVLEIYEGFNTKPLPKGERFAKLKAKNEKNSSGETYYPIKLWKKVPFDECTPKKLKELIKELEQEKE